MIDCKTCKYLRVTIVPPSDKQYCSYHNSYVDIDGDCEDYQYGEKNYNNHYGEKEDVEG